MKITILHEIRGRMRVHADIRRMSFRQADILEAYLEAQENIDRVKVYERTSNVVVFFRGDRQAVVNALKGFSFETAAAPEEAVRYSGREVNRTYWDRLVGQIVSRYAAKWFMPVPLRCAFILLKSAGYLRKGLKSLRRGRIEVAALDASAIAVSLLRRDMNTAASVMFLLGIGETLEEWTHRKSVEDLARSMALTVHKVWLRTAGGDVLTEAGDIRLNDRIVVHMGAVIPFDGVVAEGGGMVNQSSMTGEALPVEKSAGSFVYAGTALEEGELLVEVKEVTGSNRFDKIVTMIEESERLKSVKESEAEHLADRLVSYTLLGTGLVYLLTRNMTKALAVLMVDFSCALKLATPICVLSAIREAGGHRITVKGGRFLEQAAQADTIVFDKTGTLTRAHPTVKEVISFSGEKPEEMLRMAACLEEHFPHSMAKAVLQAAKDKGLAHEEKHSRVEYIMAHGISSMVDGSKVAIGSYHFIFEDEGAGIPPGKEEAFAALPQECSHLYLAVDRQLAAVVCIEDPLREEAAEVICRLRKEGINKVVMMTGDSKRAAQAARRTLGLDECYWEVLPEDKAAFVEKEKAAGRRVIMVGDGVNDSPALSAADVGIAISDGAQIAREIADITIEADSLEKLVALRQISRGLMRRIDVNYRRIVGINAALIALGIGGALSPTTSALLHNTSTLAIAMDSMKDIRKGG